MHFSDDITLIVARHDAAAISAWVLSLPKPRPAWAERLRQKLREGMDHRVAAQVDEEASLALLEHEYR